MRHRPCSGVCVGSCTLSTTCGRPRCPQGQGMGSAPRPQLVPGAYPSTPFFQRVAYGVCVGVGKDRKAWFDQGPVHPNHY
eukprot:2262186-Pleurochrysis_carterae.AAC.5